VSDIIVSVYTMWKADESEIPTNNKPSRRLSQYFLMILCDSYHLAMNKPGDQ